MAKARVSRKKKKDRSVSTLPLVSVIVILIILLIFYFLVKTIFWIALAVVAVLGAIYLYR